MQLLAQMWRPLAGCARTICSLCLVVSTCCADDLQEKAALVGRLTALNKALGNIEVATVETVQPLSDVITNSAENPPQGMFSAKEVDVLGCLRKLLRMTQGSSNPDEIKTLLRRNGQDFVQESVLKVISKNFERRYTFLSDGRVFFNVNHHQKRVSVTDSAPWMGCSYPSLLTRVCDSIPGAGQQDGVAWSSWLQDITKSPNGNSARILTEDGKVIIEISEPFKCAGKSELSPSEVVKVTRLELDAESFCPRRISRSLGRKGGARELEYFAVECSDFRATGEMMLPHRFHVSELVERPLTKEELDMLKENKVPGLLWTMLIKRQSRDIVVDRLSLLSVPVDFLAKSGLPEGMDLSDTLTGQISKIDKAIFPFAHGH